MSALRLRAPIFIVGTVRSGTTLLKACLGTHPRICWAGSELSWESCELGGIDIGSPDAPSTQCSPAGAAAATPELRERVHRGFAAIFARRRQPGESLFLDKNPHFWNKLHFLKAAFPDARLLIASRDLCSTVLSTQMLRLRLSRTRNVRHYLPAAPDSCWSLAPKAGRSWRSTGFASTRRSPRRPRNWGRCASLTTRPWWRIRRGS